MRQPADYDALSDSDLDVIFGQHVGAYICDLPAQGCAPDCNLYGKRAHYAPDDWNMPHPIGAGGDDYDDALEAARKLFGGISIEIVLFGASKHEVTVHRASRADDRDTGADPARKLNGAWTHGSERDRWVSLRRCVIKCILAIADAPLAPAIRTPTSVRAL